MSSDVSSLLSGREKLVNEINSLRKQNKELSVVGFELISAQTKLQSLLHNASDGIITFSEDGLVESFNIAAQNIFGYSESEVIKRKIPDLIPCPDWVEDNVGAYIRYFVSSRASADIPLLGKHHSGSDILLYVSASEASQEDVTLFGDDDNGAAEEDQQSANPILDSHNLVCFFRDVTLDKKLEKELADHKHALDLAAGVVVMDKHFRVIDVNEVFCHVLGRNRNEFIGGEHIHTKFGCSDSNFEQDLNKRSRFLREGNAWVGETCFQNKQGAMLWFSESTTPFLDEDNQPYQYLSIFFDITDRKEYFKELKHHRDQLQQLVDDQISDIRHSRDIAERANFAKSEFLANMSHELRTPMHAIISFAKLSLKQVNKLPNAEGNTEKLYRFINNIIISAERLLILLNDLLDLSKLEAGKEELSLERYSLSDIVSQIVEENQGKVEEKKLHLQFNTELENTEILCDKYKILQVITNLLGNAIKFSVEKTTIQITIEQKQMVLGRRATDTEKIDGLVCSVVDQGPGIPEQELSKIFDKFIQSSKTKSGSGGTGLGLTICKEIIAVHNGKIWAENNPAGGAVFRFFLPYLTEENV